MIQYGKCRYLQTGYGPGLFQVEDSYIPLEPMQKVVLKCIYKLENSLSATGNGNICWLKQFGTDSGTVFPGFALSWYLTIQILTQKLDICMWAYLLAARYLFCSFMVI